MGTSHIRLLYSKSVFGPVREQLIARAQSSANNPSSPTITAKKSTTIETYHRAMLAGSSYDGIIQKIVTTLSSKPATTKRRERAKAYLRMDFGVVR